jgi:predicted flavoprotein YhiN
MPEIFNLSRISYIQALGLLVLSKILFGSIGSDNTNKKEEPVMIKSTPASYEERLYEEWWQKSGEQSFESYLNQNNTEEKTIEGQ